MRMRRREMKATRHVLIATWLVVLLLTSTAQTGPAAQVRRNASPYRLSKPARTVLASDAATNAETRRAADSTTVVPVSVDATKALNTVGARMPGINTAVWDGSFKSE